MNDPVERLRHGDIGGLESLVQCYQVRVTRVAYLITQDTALAEEIMQSAFLQVYERIQQYDPARPFDPWLMRIVANLALKAVGRKWRQVDWDFDCKDIFPDPSGDPACAMEAQEQEQLVRKALASLKPEQRAVMVLRYYLGYSESQIAGKLARPLGTIRWRIFAAHHHLKSLLREEEP